MLDKRIEAAIRRSVGVFDQKLSIPQKLDGAIQYSVFPGGARIRPTILLSVAVACGDDNPSLADASAAALEMIHCASLVHDDLPCFSISNQTITHQHSSRLCVFIMNRGLPTPSFRVVKAR